MSGVAVVTNYKDEIANDNIEDALKVCFNMSNNKLAPHNFRAAINDHRKITRKLHVQSREGRNDGSHSPQYKSSLLFILLPM